MVINTEQGIHEVNQLFYQSLRTQDWKRKDVIFTQDVKLSGNVTPQTGTSVDTIWKTHVPHPCDIKQNIENVVLHMQGNQAIQWFQMIMFYGVHQEEFHYLQYGMSFILSYRKENSIWKISSVICDLRWVNGNSYWLNNWNLNNDLMQKPSMQTCSMVKKLMNYTQKDQNQKQIEQLLFSLTWVIDSDDDLLLDHIVGKNKQNIKNFIDLVDLPALRIHSIAVEQQQHGKALMSRMEPQHIESKVIGVHNWKMDWLTCLYEVNVIKLGTYWYIENIQSNKGIREIMPKAYFSYHI